MSFNFDRRTFLKGAGAVGAASLLPPAALLPPTPPVLPP